MDSEQQQQAIADGRQALYEQGMETRRAVLGDAHVNAALASAGSSSDLSRTAQEYVTEIGWGMIWNRSGLERKQRSLVVLSILAARGHLNELKAHTRGALNNGLTEEEIREVMVHIMGYCGFPSGLEAFRTVEPIIKAWKEENRQLSK